jgi:hypothetical protein
MEKNSKNQKEEFARRLAEKEEEKDGISINQRNIRFNFNADRPRIAYSYQRMRFE